MAGHGLVEQERGGIDYVLGNDLASLVWLANYTAIEIHPWLSRVDDPDHPDIAIIDLATRQVRQITQGRGSCEYPTWAPNGRHLAFSCNRGGRWEIAIADREGRSLRTLATGPGNNVQPDWGP